MIERALRIHLQPVVRRRRHLYLARTLALYWILASLAGLSLLVLNWLWGWTSPLAMGAVCLVAVLATILAVYRSSRFEPDYQVVARDIEQRHPDLKALLLTAIEQKPQGPGGKLGYLQKQVLREAVVHATSHDWLQSISTSRLMLADLAWAAALVVLLAILSQTLPSTSLVLRSEKEAFFASGYDVTVTPGDAEVESGTSVVVLARFNGAVPDEASLSFKAAGENPQPLSLTRNMDDPVFGGVIPDIQSDILYHVTYADKRTPQYAIRVYRSPELVRADARIVYPAYTQLGEKLVEDVRQVSVIEGSEITMTFTLNKPVTSARLVPRKGIALGLDLDTTRPNVLLASVPTDQSERYELHLLDAQGRSNKVPPRFVIDVHKNLPPDITPTFPNRDVVVSPIEEITLEADITDDYGLQGFGLTYALAGTDNRSVTLSDAEQAETKPQINYVLALEELDAQPDQLLTYYFWADDLGPNGQPRRTVSDIYFAELRPFEEIFRESESFQDQQNQQQQQQTSGQQQQNQGEELARLQKQIISATWNVKQQAEQARSMDEHQDDLGVIRDSQAEALEKARTALAEAEDPASAEALEAAAHHMEASLGHLTKAGDESTVAELTGALGAEQSAYQELLKLRQREHQIAQSRNAGSSGSASANSSRFEQQLRNLELTQEENRYETQRLAQSRQQEAQREDLQVLNRLSDLARRQKAMADKLREAEAALRQASDEQARAEALRQLKRLRDEQLESLRDMNELEQRMQNAQNRQRMAESQQQLDESRNQVRQSTEELEQGMLSQAITSTTRAGRQLEQIRDNLRRQTSGQFAEDMRTMRQEARQLDQRQQEISEELQQQMDARQRRLAGSEVNRELAEQLDQQRENLETLIDQIKDVSDRSETSEPLLSRKLYDALRRSNGENTDRALETAGQLLRRNLLPQASEIERRAGETIQKVREGIEEAAESVLGDEAESLRLAQEQLDEAIRQIDEEAARQGREPTPGQQDMQPADQGQQSSSGSQQASEEQRPAQQQSADRPQEVAEAGASGPQQPDSPGQGRPSGQRDENTDNRVPQGGDRQQRLAGGPGGGEATSERWEDMGPRGPLTGGDYRAWSDRLRDAEEMLDDRDLRDQVARIRDRAKAMRSDFVRHGTEPQWDLVRDQITHPLTELRRLISEKLAHLQSDDALVPIDRDPVPDRYADVVERYFKNLGDKN